jgi:hypothetical protein
LLGAHRTVKIEPELGWRLLSALKADKLLDGDGGTLGFIVLHLRM